MTHPDPPTTHPNGEAMVAEFEWVHDLVRRELVALRSLADDVAAGARTDHVRAQVESLAVNSPVWALRVNCLRYCRFVHAHHGLEDTAFFPRLRRANPTLNPAIDRLEHEHRVVAGHLERIEAGAAALPTDDGARVALAAELGWALRHPSWRQGFAAAYASTTPTDGRESHTAARASHSPT